MKHPFNKVNLNKAIKEYQANQNFIHTALPRLNILLAIKKELKSISNLEWEFEYNHTNVNQNAVRIQFRNQISNDFNFFYEIPLSMNFELRAYLSNSTVHFLDLYNFLIDKNIIKKDQFALKAEYHTIPHFILNTKTKRYDMSILNQYSLSDEIDDQIIDKKVKADIENGFDQFNLIFEEIIKQFKI
ncbi:hypothetical protein L3049_21165 [Labilibaculum sp. DW002]|uniref:Uncharacterized protein n=1 Tax=Paralabilibaculum antarcticum TaxID=2912572 RepID=A0ABT5VZ04_9BACT|nr:MULTISPECIES: hypothetical protein [unclassified Labilibaculum]MBI9060066.1 hypothetical protein [Labilibaculum sp.]MDE5420510.1 hypothetical protein [Labilibaculum sp. DW002]